MVWGRGCVGGGVLDRRGSRQRDRRGGGAVGQWGGGRRPMSHVLLLQVSDTAYLEHSENSSRSRRTCRCRWLILSQQSSSVAGSTRPPPHPLQPQTPSWAVPGVSGSSSGAGCGAYWAGGAVMAFGSPPVELGFGQLLAPATGKGLARKGKLASRWRIAPSLCTGALPWNGDRTPRRGRLCRGGRGQHQDGRGPGIDQQPCPWRGPAVPASRAPRPGGAARGGDPGGGQPNQAIARQGRQGVCRLA